MRAFAQVTIQANINRAHPVQINPIGINQTRCIRHIAPQPDGQSWGRDGVAAARARHGARNRKVTRPLRHADDLGLHLIGRLKRGVNVPKRAGAPKA